MPRRAFRRFRWLVAARYIVHVNRTKYIVYRTLRRESTRLCTVRVNSMKTVRVLRDVGINQRRQRSRHTTRTRNTITRHSSQSGAQDTGPAAARLARPDPLQPQLVGACDFPKNPSHAHRRLAPRLGIAWHARQTSNGDSSTPRGSPR
jgi:hypothetical protein